MLLLFTFLTKLFTLFVRFMKIYRYGLVHYPTEIIYAIVVTNINSLLEAMPIIGAVFIPKNITLNQPNHYLVVTLSTKL